MDKNKKNIFLSITLLFLMLFWVKGEILKYSRVAGKLLYGHGCNSAYQLSRWTPYYRSCYSYITTYHQRRAELTENTTFPFYNQTISRLCSVRESQLLVTLDNKIYGYGRSTAGILSSLTYVEVFYPILIASHDEIIDSIQCFDYSALYAIKSFSQYGDRVLNLHGWGRNFDKLLTHKDSTAQDYILFPLEIRKAVKFYGLSYRSTFISDYDDNIFFVGENSYYKFRNTLNSYDEKMFTLFNKTDEMIETEDSGARIKLLYNYKSTVFVVYDNNDVYGWGRAERLAQVMEYSTSSADIQYDPLKLNYRQSGSNFPTNGEWLQISCFYACYGIVRDHDLGKNIVLSWGLYYCASNNNGDMFLCRDCQESHRYIPKSILYGSELDSDDEIVLLRAGYRTTFYLSRKGYIFVSGVNYHYNVEERYGHNYGHWYLYKIMGNLYDLPMKRVDYMYLVPGDVFHYYYVMNDYDCFGIRPSNYSSCSTHGDCISQDNCNCDYTHYSGSQCEIPYQCYDIDEDDETVCTNKQGTCASPDNCICNIDHYGDQCEIWRCGGIPATFTNEFCSCIDDSVSVSPCTPVCTGRGTCDALNDCSCNVNSYGLYCVEEIFPDPRYLEYNPYLIQFRYEIPVPLLTEELLVDGFNCSLVIQNFKELSTTDPTCEFIFSGVTTSYLEITLIGNITISVGDFIYIDTVTIDDEVIPFSLLGPIVMTFWERNWIYFAAGAVLTLLLIMALIIFIVIGIVCCFNCVQKKKLKQFDQIEDLDIIIAESEASAKDNLAYLKIDKTLFEIEYEDLKLEKEIGSGGSGAVIYRAMWRGRSVAFKAFKTRFFSSQTDFDAFEREVSLISSINHPNLLRFYGCTLKPPRVGIVTELCEKGSLSHYILTLQRDNLEMISWTDKLSILMQVCNAMDFLHSRKVIHRDLKCENVLLKDDLTPKIIDFGLSKVVEQRQLRMTKMRGTSAYMAPEVTLGMNYGLKADVYSFSIVMWELLHENFEPFGVVSFNLELRVATNEDFRPKIDPKFENDDKYASYLLLMQLCWNSDDTRRPRFRTLSTLIEKLGKNEKISVLRDIRDIESKIIEAEEKKDEINIDELNPFPENEMSSSSIDISKRGLSKKGLSRKGRSVKGFRTSKKKVMSKKGIRGSKKGRRTSMSLSKRGKKKLEREMENLDLQKSQKERKAHLKKTNAEKKKTIRNNEDEIMKLGQKKRTLLSRIRKMETEMELLKRNNQQFLK